MKVSQYQFFTGGVSLPRNNTLITFFRRIGASERSGTGGPDIFKFAAINKYRLPELKTDFKSTEIKIWVAAPAYSHADFSDKEKKVFEYLTQATEARISDIQKATGFSKYAVHKTLKDLLSKKVIGTYGHGPATKYFRKPSAVEKVSMMHVLQDFMKMQE